MEIEENIYEQYRDTPYKIEDKSKKPQISESNDENLKNNKKSEVYNKYLKNIKELLKEDNVRKISDSITLRASIDKTKPCNVQDNFFNNNSKIIDENKIQLNLEEGQNKPVLEHIDKRSNVVYINHLYNKEIQNENNNLNWDKTKININKNENKVLYNNYGLNKMQNNYDLNYENNQNVNNINYNPFISNNKQIQQQNALSNNNIVNNEEKNNKIPNINLTSVKDDKLNKNKNGIFSKFFNIFSKNKKDNKINSQEGNSSNLNENNELNELETIDQKLRKEPKNINIDTIDKTNNKNEKNFLLSKDSQNDVDEEDDIFKLYNFVLTPIQVSKDSEKSKNDIDILKKGLEKKEEEEEKEEGLIEYDNNNNNNPIHLNDQSNMPFIESQNIYGDKSPNENKNVNNNNNEANKNCFYLKAEIIENNMQAQNYPDEENNLGTSSEIIDFDKSEYTIQTGTNIDHIIKKKSKYYPYLVAVLLGAGGLMFVLYKSKKIKEMIIKLLKFIPNFFKGLFGMFGKEIEDFLEKYNDAYRILGDILIVIGIWIVFKLFMKLGKKLINKNN